MIALIPLTCKPYGTNNRNTTEQKEQKPWQA